MPGAAAELGAAIHVQGCHRRRRRVGPSAIADEVYGHGVRLIAHRYVSLNVPRIAYLERDDTSVL